MAVGHPGGDAFGHHDAGEVGVAADAGRHDRRVDNAETVDAMDTAVGVNHRTFVIDGSHRSGPGGVVRGCDLGSDELRDLVIVVQDRVVDEERSCKSGELGRSGQVAGEAERVDHPPEIEGIGEVVELQHRLASWVGGGDGRVVRCCAAEPGQGRC